MNESFLFRKGGRYIPRQGNALNYYGKPKEPR